MQLLPLFSQYERGSSSGAIPLAHFLTVFEQLKVPLTSDEKYFITENYLVPATQTVDYRKFLEDLKLYGQQHADNK